MSSVTNKDAPTPSTTPPLPLILDHLDPLDPHRSITCATRGTRGPPPQNDNLTFTENRCDTGHRVVHIPSADLGLTLSNWAKAKRPRFRMQRCVLFTFPSPVKAEGRSAQSSTRPPTCKNEVLLRKWELTRGAILQWGTLATLLGPP